MAFGDLWIREVYIVVTSGNTRYQVPSDDVLKAAPRVEPLHIDFNVQASTKSKANTATITLYNLSETTRNLFDSDYQKIELFAGYKGESRLIFKGDVVNTNTLKSNDTYVTTMFCVDGGSQFNRIFFSKSFSAGTSIRKIVDSVISATGFSSIINDPQNKMTRTFNNSVTYNDRVKFVLRRALSSIDYRYSVQNGVVEIYPRGEPIKETIAQVCSTSSNIIGTPSVSQWIDRRNKALKGLKLKVLINPYIKPNSVIRVNTPDFATATGNEFKKRQRIPSDVSGLYVVKTMSIKGSNYTNNYYMDIDCVSRK